MEFSLIIESILFPGSKMISRKDITHRTIFDHQDMIYYSYQWGPTAQSGKEPNENSGDTYFDRNNGYQVLGLINKILKTAGKSGKESGQKIERFIKIDLPYSIKSVIKVEEYILKNLKV